MGNNTSNDTTVSHIQQELAALQKHVAPSTAISIDGKSMTGSQIVTFLQSAIEKRAEVTAARGAYLAAVKARKDDEVERKLIEESLRSWVRITYGAGSPEAIDFGFAKKKARAKTVETKARAILLAQATREARGTKGKRQRLKIKGTLPNPHDASGPNPGSPTPTTGSPAPAGGASPTGANGAPSPGAPTHG